MANKKNPGLSSRTIKFFEWKANVWFTLACIGIAIAAFVIVRDRFFALSTISSSTTKASDSQQTSVAKITSNIKRCAQLSNRVWVGANDRSRAIECIRQLAIKRRQLLERSVGQNPEILLRNNLSSNGDIPAPARSQMEQPVNRSAPITGVLSAVSNDGGITSTGFILTDRNNDSYQVYVSGGMPSQIQSGDRVSISQGVVFGSTIAVPQSSSAIAEIGVSRSPVLGPKKLAIVTFKVNNSITRASSNLNSIGDGIEEYLPRVSGAKTTFDVTVLPEVNVQSDTGSGCDLDTILKWTNAINLPQGYDYYSFVIPGNNNPDSQCRGRSGGYGPMDSNKNYVFDTSPLHSYIHELGHNFGAGHSVGGDQEFDPMTNILTTPVPHFNNIHKIKFGWIGEDDINRINSDGSTTLQSSELASGKRAIVITNYCNGRDYVLEKRPAVAGAVLVRCVSVPVGGNSYVDSSLVGRARVGEQFAQNNVRITPKSDGTIEVRFNGPAPTPSPGPGGGDVTREGTVSGSLGDLTLQCPVETIRVQRSNAVDVQLLARGSYSGGTVNVRIPIRGEFASPHYGIREENVGTGGILYMNQGGNLRIRVLNEVDPGSYRVPVMATGVTYQGGNQYSINSVCHFNLEVTSSPTISNTPIPSPIGGRVTASITANGESGAVSVLAGSFVTLRWSSSGAVRCSIIPQTWRETVQPNGSIIIPAESNFYNLACVGSDGAVASSGVRVRIRTSESSLTCKPLQVSFLTAGSNPVIDGGRQTTQFFNPLPFSIKTQSSGAPDSTSLDVKIINSINDAPATYPLVSLTSSTVGATAGSKILKFTPTVFSFGGAHPSFDNNIRIILKDSSGTELDRCEVGITAYPLTWNTPGRAGIIGNPQPAFVNIGGQTTITLSGGQAPYSFTRVSGGEVERTQTYENDKIRATISGNTLTIRSVGSVAGLDAFEVGDSSPVGASGYRWTNMGVYIINPNDPDNPFGASNPSGPGPSDPTTSPITSPTPTTSATPGGESFSVTIDSPNDRDKVRGTFDISARADFGSTTMQSIKIYADNVLLTNCRTSNPCSVSYAPSRHAEDYEIEIYATAKNTSGREVRSSLVTVTHDTSCSILERVLGRCK